MGIQIAETGEFQAEREHLIETKYLGSYKPYVGKVGEAYFDGNKNCWHFRANNGLWLEVTPEELDCANDSGLVRGNYLGQKSIPKEGKAYWSEKENAWIYKPKGIKRQFIIPEADFEMLRDEDY